MTTLAETNLVLIIVALLIGLAVGWWLFRATRRKGRDTIGEEPSRAELEATPPAPRQMDRSPAARARSDGPEGNGLVSQGAAATTDVAGEVLGVRAHAELPGAGGPPDDLELLKGVGPKLAARLNANGIIRYEQLARLSANEVAILDEKMGPFKGRLVRDRVVEQASYLARGDRDGFEAKFGKLGGA